MLQIDPTGLGIEFGTGAVIGGIIGFAAKKIAKLIAVIIESREILTVDWDALTAGLAGVGETAQSSTPPSWVSTIVSTLSVSAGFTGGFMIGFKRG